MVVILIHILVVVAIYRLIETICVLQMISQRQAHFG